ncbi:mitochondrial import inner membrane translocase subunit Tim10B isoform X1 [Drosophila sechellia]|uniref:Mitochondrial import inner membrane translocase subunit n=2 Tax=Drosophila sechellia TaxID=7238 RepID=B4I782_DROSE|nr:mitochondrial import inner membrane translocase subunit Tim10B isoform X1 [Drosophila sechellia]EDW56180.1 GM22727 [Drosophila sechellia]
MDSNLRNLKDFFTLYNKVTELCFSRCVDNLSQRDLGGNEDLCVDRCVTKFARFNQNMMKVYVDVQTTINAKRMEEMEEDARKAEQQQREQEKERLKEAAATAVLTPVQPPVAGNLSM